MIVKVCGMREAENIRAVADLGIDLMGFIFYPRSPRYVSETLVSTPDRVGRVGVFVNTPFDTIVQTAQQQHLTHLQLHGDESPEHCLRLKKAGYVTLKAFRITSVESFARCVAYAHAVDMFLFDTASIAYGGSGTKFDWSLLRAYTGELPYLLSGGISLQDIEPILQIKDTRLCGVDLNSRFEHAPALKDAKQLQQFINQLKQH